MTTPPKKDKAGQSALETETQIAVAREIMARRRDALRELADTIMREDREILRKLAE